MKRYSNVMVPQSAFALCVKFTVKSILSA